MTSMFIGDLAQSMVNRSAHARINGQLSDLGIELTTGLKIDRGLAATSDIADYESLERALTLGDSFASVAREAALTASVKQTAMETVSQQIDTVLSDLSRGEHGLSSGARASIVANADIAFRSVVSALNTKLGDRHLFSGVTTSVPPLRAAEDILSDLRIAAAGAPDPAGAIQTIDDYFAAGNEFDTNDYFGGSAPGTTVEVGRGVHISSDLLATDDAFRETLKELAKIVLLDDIAPVSRHAESNGIVADAQIALREANVLVIERRATLGVTEARIESALTSTASERATLERARIDMIGADPFETATRLEQMQLQLEQLYTVTARLSRLSLVNYL